MLPRRFRAAGRRHGVASAVLFAPLIVSLGAAGVMAGEPLAAHPVVGHVAAGYAGPVGAAADFFESGWQAAAGATFHVSPMVPMGMRLELGYARSQAMEQTLPSPAFAAQRVVADGHATVTHLMLDGLWEFGARAHLGGWLGAGVGVLNRRIDVTTTYPGTSCNDPVDPGSCLVSPGGRTETHDQLTQIAFDISAAARFPLLSGSEVYIEARYQRMESNPATEFVPVTVGFRW